MKRKFVCVLLVLLLLSGCAIPYKNSNNYKSSHGVWLSYFEVADILNSQSGLQNETLNIIENCKELMIDNIYIHVRSHCDAIYPSEYFPMNDNAKKYDYDVFEYMISEFHKNEIKVHAWINPYRVSANSTDINEIDNESPAFKWLNDNISENDINVCISDGIYLNPASLEVRTLIINGVKEIVENYYIDGIVFDDYFYPTTSEDFDYKSYEKYKSETKRPLTIDDWRRTNVNMLITGCYNAIKNKKENVVFTISPSHSIKRNFSEFYADAEYWMKNGIIDVIMPQLYFGFNYPDSNYNFDKLLGEWKKLVKDKYDVQLIISLATYKIGTDSEADALEWNSVDDIIARQAEICYKDEKVDGFVIFSYSSCFSKEELNTKQRENLKATLENFKYLDK